MRAFRYATTLLLLVLWFTAREHCHLEAIGWIPAQCVEDCGQADGKDDGCATVENGYYKNSANVAEVTPPDLQWDIFAVREFPELEILPLPTPENYSEPQRLIRTWQFVERAAPPSRAPAVLA